MSPENLQVLPPLDESIKDKLILLKAYGNPMSMPTRSPEEWAAFWQRRVSELPAFLYYRTAEFRIPDHLRSGRYEITHFHHPDLVAAIDALSPDLPALRTQPWRLVREMEDEPDGDRRSASALSRRVSAALDIDRVWSTHR